MSKRPRQDSNLSQVQHDSLATSAAASQDDSVIVVCPQEEGAWQPGKYTHLDASVASASSHDLIHCTLPPHKPLGFTTYEDYEIHYQKTHVNRCIECNRNFPTDHFLNLHIAENHDPLSAARRDRGDKTYQCFVEDCDKVCSTWQKRRMHLVAKHMFPRNYDFFIVNDGLDNRNSMLRPETSHRRRRRSSASSRGVQTKEKPALVESCHGGESSSNNDRAGSVQIQPASSKQENHKTDTVMDDIADSMAALKFVPKSVSFGRKQGGGLARS